MRLSIAIAFGLLVAAFDTATASAVNTADAGIQVATTRPHEVPKGAVLYSKAGKKLGVVVRTVPGKRGYVEDLYVRDLTGAVHRVPSLAVYKRDGKFVSVLTQAQIQAARR